jgi:hypothetical protein
MKSIKKLLIKAPILVGMCLLVGIVGAQAASLTVTTTADGGFGSLRQAIIDATTNAEANTVAFEISTSDNGYNASENRFTINLLTPLPDIPLAPMTISNNMAHGLTVKGNGTFRIFTLVNSAVVIMNNLTVSNGFSSDGLGGGIFMGNSSTLTLNGSTVSNNNVAASGGGIYMSNSGTLTLMNSTVRDNTASSGGGVYMFDSSTLNVNSSTINANIANNGGSGGGVYNGTSGTINAVNSTFDGNSAANRGGGIYNTATITFNNNTVSSNTAAAGGGIFNNFVATMNNNLVALNTAPDGKDLLGRGSLGNAFNGSYNLIGNADGSEGLGATTNQLGTTLNPIDPRIGALRDNGGATLTRAVLTRSPAIDKGNTSIITDQRGATRPYDNLLIPNAAAGNGADIGAFERTFSPTPFDFDADGKADISIFRPSNGEWWYQKSSNGSSATFQFGAGTDKIVPADYTADGKADVAIFRPSTGEWFILRSEDQSYYSFPFGLSGDIPAPADFDGDGKADAAVFRPSDSTWYINKSSGGTTIRQFGISTDVPVTADYDGDFMADIVVYRPSSGEWWILQSSTGNVVAFQFGSSTDKPAQGDYTGDGKTDVAIFRPSSGEWFILRSENYSYYSFPFGISTDVPAPGDFDGDGRFDATVFRPSGSTWYIQRSTAGVLIQNYGQSGDRPVPNAFIP